MNCGSCRAKNADFYRKITKGQMLFDILINLNPTIVYNPENAYFCDTCIAVAIRKFQDAAAIMSDQNANGLSVENPSFTSTTSDSSKVSSNKEASHFAPPAAPPLKTRSKPCPRRFKEQETADEIIIPANEHRNEQAAMITSSDDSESLSECDVLLNVELGGNHTERSNSRNIVAHVSIEREDDIAVEDISWSMEGSLAPVARNPRIRETNAHLTGDLQTYFHEGQEGINVNIYSRSLAG